MWRSAWIAVLLAGTATAQTPPTAAALVAGLDGRWVGTLSYRDYSNEKTETLPMLAEIQAVADNATVITVNSFQDGFRMGIVTITDVALFDDRAGRVSVASLRKRQPITVDVSDTAVAYTDPLHWTITYTSQGRDDDKPATLKVTQTRNGDSLTAVKDVRFTDPGATWIQRNTSVLRLERGAGPDWARPPK